MAKSKKGHFVFNNYALFDIPPKDVKVLCFLAFGPIENLYIAETSRLERIMIFARGKRGSAL